MEKPNIKNIIWDFDGVIIDSVPTKTRAFAHIFKDFPPQKVELLLDYHKVNGGISRFEKIAYFFSDIMGEGLDEEDAQKYAKEFADFSLLELYKPQYLIPTTVDFIRSYSQTYPMHIASGAWENDLLALCRYHNLEQEFISIHGSPTKKTVWVGYILEQYAYKAEETCIIGDTIQDYEAAKDNGIWYFGYNNTAMRMLSDVYLEDFKYLEK